MGFEDLSLSLRMRDAIANIATGVVNRMRPEERIGRVFSYDAGANTAKILFPKETVDSLVTVHCPPNMVPSEEMATRYNSLGLDSPGNIVRVAGKPGAYYISGYLGGKPISMGADIERFGTMKRVSGIASYQESSPSLSGWIIIQTNMALTVNMTVLHITGYSYTPYNNVLDIEVAFYPFTDANFYNYSVKNNGTMALDEVQLMTRNSDGKIAIAIRPANNGQWNYPKVVVDALFGHTETTLAALSGWSMSRNASLADYTVKKTYPAIPPYIRANLYQAEPTPSGSWYTLIYWTMMATHPAITYSGTSTFTIQEAGLYTVTFSAMFRNDVNSNGVRGVQILHGGNVASCHYAAPLPGQADYISATTVLTIPCFQGTTFQFQTLQNTGGTVNIHPGPYTTISIVRVG